VFEEGGLGAPVSATEAGISRCEHRSDTTARGVRRGFPGPTLDPVEVIAQAIYGAHRKGKAPEWKHASAGAKEWVRVQAWAVIAALRAVNGP
jgi:hypothetical protein